MRKIVLNIFVVLFILCFASLESFAKSKCGKYDFFCQRQSEKNSLEKSRNITDKTAKMINDENNTELNFFAGMFDFSDDGQRASLYGVEHQNHNLYRDTLIGKISPVTGFFITADNASYIYTGIETNYKLGRLNITPSFTPGLYAKGDGKDLGSVIEFKSDVQLSYDVGESMNLGMSYNHVSNASLGDKNPGANSYMFNFLKKF